MKIDDVTAIERTRAWIKSVVIDCNFCPFAAKPFNDNSIRFTVSRADDLKAALGSLLTEVYHLDEEPKTETTLLIFPESFDSFEDYLDLVDAANHLLAQEGYDGVYQLASFHPEYCFADADPDDPANYTNRSIYPMLHLLREESVEKALRFFKEPEQIPERNMRFAREKGLQYMQFLRTRI